MVHSYHRAPSPCYTTLTQEAPNVLHGCWASLLSCMEELTRRHLHTATHSYQCVVSCAHAMKHLRHLNVSIRQCLCGEAGLLQPGLFAAQGPDAYSPHEPPTTTTPHRPLSDLLHSKTHCTFALHGECDSGSSYPAILLPPTTALVASRHATIVHTTTHTPR